MLLHLSVDNFILIDHLEIDFEDGFSVITGETGAGKSILVGALGLILGQRADTLVLHDKDRKCIVEGAFKIENYGLETIFIENDLDYDTKTTIRREITPQGKSRAFVNDTPVNLAVLKQLGDKLVDIHSQNQTLELNEAAFQLSLVDSYAAKPELLSNYTRYYDKFVKTRNELSELRLRHEKANADRDYQQFLFDELHSAGLREGELEEAESEFTLLTHSEEIRTRLFSVLNILNENEPNLIGEIASIRQAIDQAVHLGASLSVVSERLETIHIDLKDIYTETAAYADQITFDQERIEQLTARIDLINHLLRKHKKQSENELLILIGELEQSLGSIESLQSKIEEMESALDELRSQLQNAGSILSESRKNVIPFIEGEMVKKLADLGMPSAVFTINHQLTADYTRSGTDKVTFMFSANKGGEPRELQKVASGGELSRLMLAVKSLVLSRSILPTILFDEIDSGVSGEIAGRIGSILSRMAGAMQVIAITHLPQIAGKSKLHYLAYKEEGEKNTFSNLRRLSQEERINEIARMLSDDMITETAKAAARELIRN